MAELQTQLSNINFMSKERFDSLETIDDGQLYAVEFPFTDEDLVHTRFDEEISGVKTFNDNITAPNQVDYTRITNCVTEIPQDIKLELKDGVLTLKAGSKVYVPNGLESDGTTPRFDEVVIESDITTDLRLSEGDCFIFVNNGSVFDSAPQNTTLVYSSEGAPTSNSYNRAYDYVNNHMYYRHGTDDWSIVNYSFPIAIVTADSSNNITGIKQTFNGIGYIGSVIFSLPGVKGLIPNKRNEDGTLKSKKFINDRVTIKDVSSRANTDVILIGKNYITVWNKNSFLTDEYPAPATNKWWMVYDSEKNIHYNSSAGADYQEEDYFTIGGEYTRIDGQITSFIIKPPFRAADYNDLVALDSATAKLDGDNTFTGTVTFTQPIQGTAYRALWGDLAEYYESDKEYPRGTLVQFGGSKEITIASNNVNAVITSEPGFILNTQQRFNAETSQAIALVGKVPVRAIGKVNKFDYLTLSDTPGVATVWSDKELPNACVIARALENKNTDGEGLVFCTVKFEL